MSRPELTLLAPAASHGLAARVASELAVPLAALEEREFEGGEHKVRPLASVRGHDVYVLHSLYGEPGASANDKLMRLLLLIGALRDAGAHRVSAIAPYLCYSRKDVRKRPGDPTSTRYVAQLFEALGADRIAVLEVHNPAAYFNAFRIGAEHLTTAAFFARHLVARLGRDAPVVVVSPDPGGFKRAQRLREALARRTGREIGLALMEKTRDNGRITSGHLVGMVSGCIAIVVDDMIASGSTLAAAAQACRALGSEQVLAVAAHGLFAPSASELLAGSAIDRVLVTDSVGPFPLQSKAAQDKVEVLSAAPLLAEAIRRLHADESLAELLEER